jgi:hypothetical protein
MEHVYGSSLRPARPGRAPVVVADLALLRGPTGGVVELPPRLLWQADRRVDLDQPGHTEWLYALVLREATKATELCAHLDGPTLRRLWRELFLPSGLRAAWESRHPELLS